MNHLYWLLKLGNALINFVIKRGLAHTAVLVHGAIVHDEEYLDPLSCYTNASIMLDCLRTAGKCQYWICLCNCFCRRSNDARGRATANTGCAITQHSLSVEKAELETPGFEFCTLFSLKSWGDLQRFWGGWTKTWSKETLLRKLWQTATRPKNAVLALAQLLLYSSSFLSGILCCTETSLCYSSSWWKHLFSEL